MVLFNHSIEDFAVKAADQIAQLIFERIEIPHVKKVAAFDDIDNGAEGFKNAGTKQLTQSRQPKDKKGKNERILYPQHQVHDSDKYKIWLKWWSAQSWDLLLRVGWPRDLPMDGR